MTAKHKRTTMKHKAHAPLTTPADIVLERVTMARNDVNWFNIKTPQYS